MRIVGCFLEYNDTFLILLRKSHKPNGGTWGLPAGKVQRGEQEVGAVLRELEEETGYHGRESELEHLGDFDFGNDKKYVFGAYRIRLSCPHEVTLEDDAHDAFEWVTGAECHTKKNLIADFHQLLERVGYA